MGSNPLNLGLRFILELVALYAFGRWGWQQNTGWLRFALAPGLPLLAMILWGTFAVPADPSRSGNAPIPTPGAIRLLLELAFFATATWCFHTSGLPKLGLFFGVVVLIHYALSYDRIAWLLRK